MGDVFLKRAVASCWLLHLLLRASCVSFRANSVTWNPHKMMGVLLQCSAILVKEKVCPSPKDELVACTPFRRHKKRKAWVFCFVLFFLQYWLRNSQDWQPHWACHGCSFLPAHVSLRLTQHILLALALNCPSSLFSPHGPASDRNYKGIIWVWGPKSWNNLFGTTTTNVNLGQQGILTRKLL